MPRLVWTKKDAHTAIVIGKLCTSCDPMVSEWTNPAVRNNSYCPAFGGTGVTRGTEISKYPEEKKSNEIPLVSDERTGKSPNRSSDRGCRTQIINSIVSRTLWNKRPKRMKVP